MRIRALFCAIAIALALLPASALVVSADEGPPFIPLDGGPRIRPPLSGPSSVAIPSPRPSGTGTGMPNRRELVIVIGGYGSSSADDRSLDHFIAELATDPRYDVRRFGRNSPNDPYGAFPYDTLGPLDGNARSLIDEIRAMSPDYAGVHLVTHSMGGSVADRAFALGLSAQDGVRTHTSLSAPHDGSLAARLVEWTLDHAGPARADVAGVPGFFRIAVDTPAMRDLARQRAGAAPAGVTRLDIRMANDELVGSDDARDGAVASRVLLPSSIEGHGGILSDQTALELTRRTIATGVVPPPTSDARSEQLAGGIARATDGVGLGLVLLACAACVAIGWGIYAARRIWRREAFPTPFGLLALR